MLNDQTYKISQERSAHCNRKELRAGTRGDLSAKRPLTKPTPKSTKPDSTIERYKAVRPAISR